MLTTHTGEQVAYPLPMGPATFNITNEHISWAGFSWNPVTGCLHGCEYCYAREIALPPTTAAHFPAGFTPLFHHERLLAPANTKVPADAADDPRRKRVFVCSMADLYGRWVPREWIVAVHEACIAFSSGTI
jgi:DNA repair photolyase